MFSIAICEDNEVDLALIQLLVNDYIKQNKEKNLTLQCFRSADTLNEYIKTNGGFSIYLLDIVMPGTDGIRAGEIIRETDDSSLIIYLTSSPHYAVSSYKVQAFHYLLKPVDIDALYKVLDDAVRRLEEGMLKSYTIKTPHGLHLVRFHNVAYVECKAHTLIYYLADGQVIQSVTTRQPFGKAAETLLADERFIKISACYIVNMTYVKTVVSKGLTMSDGANLSVSRSLYASVKQAFISFAENS